MASVDLSDHWGLHERTAAFCYVSFCVKLDYGKIQATYLCGRRPILKAWGNISVFESEVSTTPSRLVYSVQKSTGRTKVKVS